MNKIYSEARCKIIWGESPESVRTYLTESDLGPQEVDEILETLLEERYASVRKHGIRKLIKATLVLIGCSGFLFLLYSSLDTETSYNSRRGGGGLALAIIGIMWALWKGTDALVEITNPTKFKGEIGIHAD